MMNSKIDKYALVTKCLLLGKPFLKATIGLYTVFAFKILVFERLFVTKVHSNF
jgi:hypothetical protein